jgi:hypothetical protein
LVLAHREGQRSQILTVKRQDVEGVELDFLVVPARVANRCGAFAEHHALFAQVAQRPTHRLKL